MSHRSVTVTWEDPLVGAREGARLAGREYLQAMIDGRLPRAPIAALLGFELVEVKEGFAAFECRPEERHYNPIGTVHGGLACTLLDSAMGCSVHSTLPAGMAYTTLELKVNLVRPVTAATGTLRCEGRLIHAGRRTATAEGKLLDTAGKLYAHGTTTCLISPVSERA